MTMNSKSKIYHDPAFWSDSATAWKSLRPKIRAWSSWWGTCKRNWARKMSSQFCLSLSSGAKRKKISQIYRKWTSPLKRRRKKMSETFNYCLNYHHFINIWVPKRSLSEFTLSVWTYLWLFSCLWPFFCFSSRKSPIESALQKFLGSWSPWICLDVSPQVILPNVWTFRS